MQLKVHLKGPAAEPTDEVYPELHLHVKPPSAAGSDTGCLQEKVQVKGFRWVLAPGKTLQTSLTSCDINGPQLSNLRFRALFFPALKVRSRSCPHANASRDQRKLVQTMQAHAPDNMRMCWLRSILTCSACDRLDAVIAPCVLELLQTVTLYVRWCKWQSARSLCCLTRVSCFEASVRLVSDRATSRRSKLALFNESTPGGHAKAHVNELHRLRQRTDLLTCLRAAHRPTRSCSTTT